jgi:hypothetical protein
MRTLRLARVAAEAERLRIKRLIRRLAIRAALGAVAALFGIAALVSLHVLVWLAIRRGVGPIGTSAILVGVDVVLALIFFVLAGQGREDRVEAEARQLRNQAVAGIRQTASLAAMVASVASAAGRSRSVARGISALAAWLFRRG